MRSLVAILGTAVALLAAAAPAQASPLSDALAVADAYWQPNACAGRTQVTVGQLPAQYDAYATGVRIEADSSVPWGYRLTLAACTVTIRPGLLALDRERVCEVIVHEVGHLNGHVHDEGGVMRPDAGVRVPACVPSRAIRAREAMRDILPWGYRWRVRCGPQRCRATAPTAKQPRTYSLRFLLGA